MAMLVAYEVQTYETGSWQIASVHEDKELALMEARRMEEGLRRRETRVVEEMHDEESGKTRSKIVYVTPKIGAGETQAAAGSAPKGKKQPGAVRGGGKRAAAGPGRTRAQPQATQPNALMIGLMLFSILSIGFVALIALRHF
jgi:hypothetical protein